MHTSRSLNESLLQSGLSSTEPTRSATNEISPSPRHFIRRFPSKLMPVTNETFPHHPSVRNECTSRHERPERHTRSYLLHLCQSRNGRARLFLVFPPSSSPQIGEVEGNLNKALVFEYLLAFPTSRSCDAVSVFLVFLRARSSADFLLPTLVPTPLDSSDLVLNRGRTHASSTEFAHVATSSQKVLRNGASGKERLLAIFEVDSRE